jgi:hypothetical protein
MLNRIRSRYRTTMGNGPWLFAGVVGAALIITPMAVAFGEGKPILGGKRSPSQDTSKAFTNETQIIADTTTYGTRQSNKSDNGGGAIYGCRSAPGGTEKGNEPCIRANNLNKGRAFEFDSGGTEVGRITSSNPNAAPFTTNAGGVATGLNADKVDGKSADQIAPKFAVIAANGTLGGTRGATAAKKIGDGTYEVTFADDIANCAYTATETTITDAGAVGVQAVDAKTLNVRTRKGGGADGTGTSDPADRPFHLVVTC